MSASSIESKASVESGETPIENKNYNDFDSYNSYYEAMNKYKNTTLDLMDALSSPESVLQYLSKNIHISKRGTTPMNNWHMNKTLCNCWTWHTFGIQSGKCDVCIFWAPISDDTVNESFPKPPSPI
jgi:hypothetical protein